MLAQGFGSKPAKAKKIKTRTPKASQPCPCFSGKPYGECCKPFHEGEKKPQPVEVMRARYAAFAWCVSRAVTALTGNHSVFGVWGWTRRNTRVGVGASSEGFALLVYEVLHQYTGANSSLSGPSSVWQRTSPPQSSGCMLANMAEPTTRGRFYLFFLGGRKRAAQ